MEMVTAAQNENGKVFLENKKEHKRIYLIFRLFKEDRPLQKQGITVDFPIRILQPEYQGTTIRREHNK